MKDNMDVRLSIGIMIAFFLDKSHLQIAISAGHEFTISTDPQYCESCDDKTMFVDYVCIRNA
jgi:hypothetical protein